MLNKKYKYRVMYLFETTHDNRDKIIASKLGLSVGLVSQIIQKELNKKIDRINQRVNLNYEYEQKQLRASKKNEQFLNLVSKESKQ